MLQAHSVEIQEFNFHSILCENSFCKIWISKSDFFYNFRDTEAWILVNLGLETLLKVIQIKIQNL